VLLKAMLAAREGRRPGAPLTPRAERLLKRLPALLLLLQMLLLLPPLLLLRPNCRKQAAPSGDSRRCTPRNVSHTVASRLSDFRHGGESNHCSLMDAEGRYQ